MKWIDIHAHLDRLEHPPEEGLRLADLAGVERMITIGTCPDDLNTVHDLAQKYYPRVACTIGVHPHDAKLWNPGVAADLDRLAPAPWVVGIGETGLDYYYDNSGREEQKEVFRRQLELAIKHGLPVEVHTRDAESDTVAIIGEYRGRARGVIHCFSGTQWLADEALALGFDISISGIVTFKNAEALRAVVKTIPLERLHVETDAPFLAPVPFRGKKNTPAFLPHTAKVVAELKGVSEEQLSQQTVANARRLFNKWNWSH